MWTKSSRKFCETLGLSYPIIQAPMAGGPTTPALVSAVSEAGGLGFVGAGYMKPDALRETITEIRRATDKPFGVNVFVLDDATLPQGPASSVRRALLDIAEDLSVSDLNLEPSVSSNLDAHLDVLIEQRVPVVSCTFGVLTADRISALRAGGSVVVGTATTSEEAKALEEAGCDAIVLQGFEAGGHRGAFLANQPDVGLFALVPQTCDRVSVPVIASGGIMDGRGIAAALSLGAAAVQMGTAFLTVDESGASPVWKQEVRNASDVSTVLTKAFSGKRARGKRNEFVRRFEALEDEIPAYPLQNRITTTLRAAAKAQGRGEYMSLWAGQAAALSRTVPAAELMTALVDETEHVLDAFEVPRS